MFKSFNFKYLDHDSKKAKYRYEIIIVDDDFTEVADALVCGRPTADAAAALITIYSRRNLNVAGNLALFMQFTEHEWSWRSIEWHQKEIPEYPKYHDQVIGYLAFM